MLFLLALNIGNPASAFEILTNDGGYEIRYHAMPVEFSINPDNAEDLSDLEATTAILDSLYAWEDAEDSNVSFEDNGVTSTAAFDYDGVNTIYFEDDWAWDPGLLALTANWSDLNSGQLLGFDIAVNTMSHDWTVSEEEDRADLQNAMTHEVGHALGLDHTDVDETAAMFGTAITGELIKRELKWDDKAGANYLYGNGALAQEKNPLACSASSGAGGGFIAFFALALMLPLRRTDHRGEEGRGSR